MPGKISFGPTAYDLFVDAQERKKENEKDFTISFKVDKNEYQLMEKFINHWFSVPKIPDIAFPRFGPEKTFTACWGPTTIHPSTDMMHQHTLNHLQNQLQVAADKAWKSIDIEPKANLFPFGFPSASDYCSAALSAVKAAECIVVVPANHYPDVIRTHHCFSPKYSISMITKDDNIPLDIWLKAGTPPNGRTKAQHILIKSLNKTKKKR